MNEMFNNNGYEYVDLGLPSGTIWATMNVGASKPSDFGLYFQWGSVRGFTKGQIGRDKAFSWSTYKWSVDGIDSNFSKYNTVGDTLDLEDDAANIHMGGDWHMPTPTQIRELISETDNTWTTQDGVNGRLFTSKNNGKSIFIPAAGYAWGGSFYDSGGEADVWSSTLKASNVNYGRHLSFDSYNVNLSNDYRYFGFSVRGVIDKNNKNMNLSELIKNEIKNNFKVKVNADYGGYVNVELLYDGEVISSDVCQVITDFNSLDE